MSFGRKKARVRKTYDEASLYEYAIGALGRRMRTVAELKRLMRQKLGAQPGGEELVEKVVTKLKDQKYLNDSAYAAAYSGFRRDNEKFGKRRVISDLKQKGVHGDIIEQAVGVAFGGTNEEQLAREYLRRKRMQKPANEKQAARIFRALLRAGFSIRTIYSILKKWDVEDEVLTALETETEL